MSILTTLIITINIIGQFIFFILFFFIYLFFCASFYVICNLPIDYLFPLPFTQSKARRSLLLSLHAIQLCLACVWHSSLHSLNPDTSLYLRDWRELCPDSSSAFTVSLQMVRKLYSIHSTEPHTRFSKLMYSRPHTKDYCVGRYTEICIISDRSRPFSWLCLIFPVNKGSPMVMVRSILFESRQLHLLFRSEYGKMQWYKSCCWGSLKRPLITKYSRVDTWSLY